MGVTSGRRSKTVGRTGTTVEVSQAAGIWVGNIQTHDLGKNAVVVTTARMDRPEHGKEKCG